MPYLVSLVGDKGSKYECGRLQTQRDTLYSVMTEEQNLQSPTP